jgi:hypothetical protein
LILGNVLVLRNAFPFSLHIAKPFNQTSERRKELARKLSRKIIPKTNQKRANEKRKNEGSRHWVTGKRIFTDHWV